MRDLSKVKQKSRQQTWELHHAALTPCPFTLRLQQQTYSLEKGSFAQQAAPPETQKRPSVIVGQKPEGDGWPTCHHQLNTAHKEKNIPSLF